MRKSLAAAALTAGLALAPAVDAVHAQDATADDDDGSDKTGLIGLVGLLGLAGLAGLKRRDNHTHNNTFDTRRDTGSVR